MNEFLIHIKKFSLNEFDYFVLKLLSEKNEVSTKEILLNAYVKEQVFVSQPYIYKTLNKLALYGLIEKEERGKREVVAKITEKGRKVKEKLDELLNIF